MKRMALFALLILAASLSAQSMAKIADQLYAPEQLTISVLEVNYTPCEPGERTVIEVKAEVVAVKNTATRLEPGSKITIKYNRYNPPEDWTGPASIPILQQGRQYYAYMSTYRYSYYVPVAGNASFSNFQDTLALELADIQRGVQDIQENVADIENFLNQ